MSRLDLGLRPDVSEIPAAVDDAEWFAAELDRHEMVDGEVPPALVREAVLAELGGFDTGATPRRSGVGRLERSRERKRRRGRG